MASNAKVAEIYVELQAKTAQFKAALNEATNETRKFAAEVRHQSHEAQASMALLGEEIGVKLPRHLRSFVAGLPGVASAMSAAFNTVAVLALINIVVEAGKKVYEFAEKTEKAADKNRKAWETFTGGMEQTNDQLRVTNDKLEESIAKLEGKPENGLKTALDEAVLSADELGKKLDSDFQKFSELMKTQSVSLRQQLFGQASTDDIEKTWKDLDERINKAKTEGNEKIRAARDGGSPEAVKEAQREMESTLRELYSEGHKFASDVYRNASIAKQAQDDFKAGKYNHPVSEMAGYNGQNMDGRIALSSGMMNLFGNESDYLTKKDRNANDQGKLAQLQGAKDISDALLKSLEKALRGKELLHGKSVEEEATYWSQYLNTFTEGTDQWIAVNEKFLAAEQALQKTFSEKGKLTSSIKGYNSNLAETQGDFAPDQNQTSAGTIAATARRAVEQAKLNEEWQRAADRLGLLNGAISAHQVALDEAAAHASTYREEIAALQQELADLQKQNPFEADERQIAVASQIDTFTGRAQIQAMIDAQAVLTTTWKGMVDGVWDELIHKSQETQQELEHIALTFVDGINSQLAKVMTNQHADFGQVFRSASESLAKAGLHSIEGSITKSLGLGTKRDGSSADAALYVKDVSGLSGLDTSVFGKGPKVTGPDGVMGKVGGGIAHGLLGMLNDSNWASSLFGGKLFGSGSVFGSFATGGDVMGGVPIEVGELGPERFVPPSNGRIVPNKDLNAGGPSVGYIDARGTDPVQTQMAVHRAMIATHAQAVRDAQHSMADRQRRRA